MILPRYFLERVELPTECPGSWYDLDGKTIIAKTLEQANRGNAISSDPDKSGCIDYGVHLFVWQPPRPDRNYEYYRCVHAPGRHWYPDTKMSSILVHPITYVKGLLGCIGVGSRHADLNNDGVPDMIESTKKLKWMTTNLPKAFELEIRKKQQ